MFGRSARQDRAEEQVAALGWWYQHFQLPSGVWTGDGSGPAYEPGDRWKLFAPYIPDDLSGKTVLDVGGNAGYFSVQMKLRGAKKCVMVEPVIEFVDQARFVFSQFGVRVKIVDEDVHAYCLTTNERFDYVLFLGLFYHLKYPVLVLDRLAEMTKARLVFAAHISGGAEHAATDGGADVDREDVLSATFPQLAFIEHTYRGDPTNWWIPNYQALEPLARSAGLKVLARPHPEMLITEPERRLGTARFRRLVFPRYGKTGGLVLPGPQHQRPIATDQPDPAE
jgi:tRNA (mo5U34)-methyltransferase